MPSIGGPVVDMDFFNREEELKQVVELLRNDNVLLMAPRRYGKTSLMREIERRIRLDGKTCLFLDVMYVYSPQEFMVELADTHFSVSSIPKRKRFLNALREFFSRINEVEASIEGHVRIKFRDVLKKEINGDNWTKSGDEILNAIVSSSDETPVYIFIDELSECVNNIAKSSHVDAAKFLQWFRSKRQTAPQKLRFLVSGSVGFDRIVKEIDARALAWINDFVRVRLSGFPRAEALKFVEACFEDKKLEYSVDVGEKILECLGQPYVPYFIAVFVSIIYQRASGKVTAEQVEKIYSGDLLGSYGRGYFEYYKQRLRTYPEPLMKAADRMLREICLVDDGFPLDLAFGIFKEASGIEDYERFMNLVSDLENDFYIKIVDKKLVFQSKVLRDWWRLYYG